MQREVGGVTARTPDLASKALGADRHWGPRLTVLDEDGLGSFRGLYTFLFRDYSGLIHATFRGLNRVTEDVSEARKRVVLQAPLEGRGPYGKATVVYGLGLYVAAEALGWPSADEVNAVFTRYPDA